jgi:hypothetical protein
MRLALAMIGAALLGACQQQATPNAAVPANEAQSQPAADNEAPPPLVNATENAALPSDRIPLEEPNGPIDPKSPEAAGQVVQHYGALIEQKRWREAGALWGSGDDAAKAKADVALFSEVHLEIGKPGETEGAAGSIYVDVPVIFYGLDAAGKKLRKAATIILRRVNDVPGSSAAQRRWHIYRIEWKSPA